MLDGTAAALAEACRSRGLAGERELLVDERALPMTADVIAGLRAACEEVGVSPLLLPSGAGHDARHMAALGPVGMLFVPSAGGVSHAPDEYTTPEDLCLGVQALAHALVRLAGRA